MGYAPIRLHALSASSWSVVSVATGAIATDADDRLLMRLPETDARRIAAEMTEAEPESRGLDGDG